MKRFLMLLAATAIGMGSGFLLTSAVDASELFNSSNKSSGDSGKTYLFNAKKTDQDVDSGKSGLNIVNSSRDFSSSSSSSKGTHAFNVAMRQEVSTTAFAAMGDYAAKNKKDDIKNALQIEYKIQAENEKKRRMDEAALLVQQEKSEKERKETIAAFRAEREKGRKDQYAMRSGAGTTTPQAVEKKNDGMTVVESSATPEAPKQAIYNSSKEGNRLFNRSSE